MYKLNLLSNSRITYYRGNTPIDAKPIEIPVSDFITTGIAKKLSESIFRDDTILDFSIFDHDEYVNPIGNVRYLRYIMITWDGISVRKYSGKIYEDAPITWDLDEML